jgi:membrane protein implicated in regulation of membrane protease activity
MSNLFLYCALIGGTFLVCQFVMTLLGLGHSGIDGEISHDIADTVDVHGGDSSAAGIDGDVHGHGTAHGSSWLFGILSIRTLVAATTFFGLAGMTASTAAISISGQLIIAITCGGAALFGVHWLMRSFYRLGQSGTLRISRTIGKTARVNIPIPGGNSGQGKVQLKVQGRLAELPAVTASAETLPTGSQAVVIGVTRGNILEVEPLRPTVEVARRI